MPDGVGIIVVVPWRCFVCESLVEVKNKMMLLAKPVLCRYV